MLNRLTAFSYLFLIIHFAHAQDMPIATWLRHTCGYTDGVNLYGGDVWGDAVCADKFGNSYNAGYFMDYWFTMDEVIEMGSNRFYINKYDSLGNRIWTAKAMGTTINSIMTCTKMQCDDAGNIYLCGNFSVDDSVFMAPNWYPVGGGFIAKYDADGNNIWCKYVSRTSTAGITFTDLTIADNAIYACGIGNYGTIIFDGETLSTTKSQNGIIAKLNLDGDLLKLELLDGNSTNELYGISASAITGNVYMVGQHISGADLTVDGISHSLVPDATNSIIIKMNNELEAQWIEGGLTYLNPSATWGFGTKSLSRVGIDKFDNIYAIGNGNGDSTRYGSLGFEHIINGGYMQDVYIVKYSTTGEAQWLRYGGSGENDLIRDIAVDANGNAVVSVFSGFNALGAFVFDSDSIQQYYGGLVKYDPDGNILYARALQEGRSLKALAMGIDSTYFGTGTDFSTGMPYLNLSIPECENTEYGYNNAPYKMIMVKFYDTTSIEVIEEPTATIDIPVAYRLYPNPVANEIMIEPALMNFQTVSIYNVMGAKLISLNSTNLSTIDVSHLDPGVYVLTIHSKDTEKNVLKFRFIKN